MDRVRGGNEKHEKEKQRISIYIISECGMMKHVTFQI